MEPPLAFILTTVALVLAFVLVLVGVEQSAHERQGDPKRRNPPLDRE